MSIYNSQSPFNQGTKRSEITAANKQRRQSSRQRVKDIKAAGGPEFYQKEQLKVPLPKPELKQRKSVGKRIVKQKAFKQTKLQVSKN